MITLMPIVLPGEWKSRHHRAAALTFATRRAPPGVWIEAGVAEGWSARFIVERLKPGCELHLFDSFQGLPEAWGSDHPAGTFAAPAPSFDDHRVTVHVGEFDATLPAFTQSLTRPVAFVHIDCDLYDSAMTVLRALSPHLMVGTVIAFDEAIGKPECLEHEGRAITDWQAETGRRLTPIARTRYTQLVTEVNL